MKAVSGKKIVYLYRPKKDEATKEAAVLAFTTENSRSKSKDADATITKDGAIRTPGGGEEEITATSLLAQNDPIIDRLQEAMDDDEIISIWEVNMAEPAGSNANKYKGRYFEGYLTEFELSSSAEDMAEISLTFGINGTGKPGEVTMTDTQAAIADYVFKDTTKTTGA